MPIIAEYFDSDLSPDRLILFLEEYFTEEAPEYHITAAGSLLGVAVQREKYSFPVGKVLMKTLYPLEFDEFLEATGNKHLVKLIQEHYINMQEMPQQMHKEIMIWLRRYLFAGGMPAVVKKYVDEKELVNIPELQSMILSATVCCVLYLILSGKVKPHDFSDNPTKRDKVTEQIS